MKIARRYVSSTATLIASMCSGIFRSVAVFDIFIFCRFSVVSFRSSNLAHGRRHFIFGYQCRLGDTAFAAQRNARVSLDRIDLVAWTDGIGILRCAFSNKARHHGCRAHPGKAQRGLDQGTTIQNILHGRLPLIFFPSSS